MAFFSWCLMFSTLFLLFVAAFLDSTNGDALENYGILGSNHLRRLIQKDGIRYQTMLDKLEYHAMSKRVQEGEVDFQFGTNYKKKAQRRGRSSIVMKIRAGADDGVGQYFVTLKAGTPGGEYQVVADTGSDLSWVHCLNRCGRGDRRQRRRNTTRGRLFCGDYSSSFKALPCSSRMCKVDLANLFSLVRYADGSAAMGLFANETITVQLTNGREKKLHNTLLGCSQRSKGQTFEIADGVLGLGYSKYSFAVKAAKHYGGKFSYCLVDHLSTKNISNYLSFYSREVTTNSRIKMQHTELILGVLSSFYAVQIEGISIDNVILNIPREVFDANGKGGTILDSGTSLTFLTKPAYLPVIDSLKKSLSNFKKVDLGIGPLGFCFDSTGFQESLIPRLVFHFANGAKFIPHVKSYVIDAAPNVKCLGILSASWPGQSVIGNIMQQEHVWEFDLVNRKLGFSPSTCNVL
ncbi:hypothetical protein Leryth_011352 [Lithospermum erythrorhizon]|nr:hypothetical protein Leryth_011352 [Lithospermum erythrorhizon]